MRRGQVQWWPGECWADSELGGNPVDAGEFGRVVHR